jgi:hypothetical protein
LGAGGFNHLLVAGCHAVGTSVVVGIVVASGAPLVALVKAAQDAADMIHAMMSRIMHPNACFCLLARLQLPCSVVKTRRGFGVSWMMLTWTLVDWVGGWEDLEDGDVDGSMVIWKGRGMDPQLPCK